MKRFSRNFLFAITMLCSVTTMAQEELIAFPGAEGFGCYTTGGRGGAVYHVTTLEDGMQEGTLRWANEQPGPKTIVFDVSGTIFLKSPLRFTENTTIAGQTAPGDGICIADYPVMVGPNNIIRYLRFRLGNREVANHEGDGLGGSNMDNIIVDHCSISWSIDECLSVYGNRNFTVQWCIISQSLNNAGHKKGAHGYGGNWGGSGASYHHNLIAHHTSRTPRLGPSPFTQTDERMDFRNNVIYNWTANGCYGGEAMTVNIINNYYKPGPGTPTDLRGMRITAPNIRTSQYTHHDSKRPNVWDKMWHVWGKYYVSGNVNTKYPEVTKDNWTYGIYNQIDPAANDGTYTEMTKDTIRLSEPMPVEPVTTQTAEEAYRLVLRYAGASLHRDALDRVIIRDVMEGKATYIGKDCQPGIINNQYDVDAHNPWPTLRSTKAPLDSDGDGMPDEWEQQHGLNPKDAQDRNKIAPNGYTFLEVYLNDIIISNSLSQRRQGLRETRPEFFQTDEARRIGDQVLLYQRVTGGWPKNIDMSSPMSEDEKAAVLKDKQRKDDSTTDNGATNLQLTYLARLYQATKDNRYRNAFRKGIDYLLSGQYENGGWPQFWPDPQGYQIHITYNDDAMVNTLNMLKDVAEQRKPYDGELTDKQQRKRMQRAFDKGIECILATQIVTDGELTVWCQQHDKDTYLPAPARAFELPSYCSSESASILQLLMRLPNPDQRVKNAIHAGMRWFDKYKLTGLRIRRRGEWRGADSDTWLEQDATAAPIWARYYDLEYNEPFVCDRDGIPRRRLEQIGHERRNGYAWFIDRIGSLYPTYEKWAAKYDPQHQVPISLMTKGANENGTIDMYRRPRINLADFDAVVEPGQQIQAAIEKAPEHSDKPFKIFIKKGIYNQKVVIDRPNIVLVGEQRDSTIIQMAELSKKPVMTEYQGKPVKHGVVELLEGADNCIISGLTIYNNYGTTVEPTTAHQFAVYGRATNTIVINSNIQSDGNDALSLWAPDGNGMYYHADLDITCSGVDFLCPRGWCYATRCHFMGDGHAIIWHDGRGDKSKKLVILDSKFDAKSPTTLGRWHHDSQFYLIHCQLTKNILDEDIHYAYTDKVLDPCPWGKRVYYYACTREGGDSGWLKNNLDEAEGQPAFHGITALWTFHQKWNPEAHIRELWNVLAY